MKKPHMIKFVNKKYIIETDTWGKFNKKKKTKNNRIAWNNQPIVKCLVKRKKHIGRIS